MAADGAGNVLVAMRLAPSGSSPWRLEVVERRRGGSFGAPILVSSSASTEGSISLDVAANGGAVIAWEESGVAGTALKASVRPAAGVFGAPELLAANSRYASAAINEQGAVIVVWNQETPGAGSLNSAMRPPGGPFEPARALGPTGSPIVGSAAIDQAGNALVAWKQRLGASASAGSGDYVHSALRPAGGEFGAPAPAAGLSPPWFAPLLSNARGDAALITDTCEPQNRNCKPTIASGTVGGGLGPPRVIVLPVLQPGSASYAIEPTGSVAAVWLSPAGAVQTATVSPDGSLSAPQTLSAAGVVAADPTIAIGPDGTGAVAWDVRHGVALDPIALIAFDVQAAVRAAGAPFGPPRGPLDGRRAALQRPAGPRTGARARRRSRGDRGGALGRRNRHGAARGRDPRRAPRGGGAGRRGAGGPCGAAPLLRPQRAAA